MFHTLRKLMNDDFSAHLDRTGQDTIRNILTYETPSLSLQKYPMKRRTSSNAKDRFLTMDRKALNRDNFDFFSFLESPNDVFIGSQTMPPKNFINMLSTPSSTKYNNINSSSRKIHGSFRSPGSQNKFGHNRKNLIKPKIIETILEAPDVINEFPSQLIDISNKNSIIVALGSAVYLWQKGNVTEVLESELDINSVCWVDDHVVISAKGQVELWDVNKCQIIRSFVPHDNHVGSISSFGGYRIATGGDDSIINISDVRSNTHEPLFGLHGEVTNVKWSPDGSNLASISDVDEKVMIWGNNGMKSIFNNKGNSCDITSLAWQSYHVVITADDSENGNVRYIPIQSHDELKTFQTGAPISSISYTPKWGLAIAHRGMSAYWEIRNSDFKRNAYVGGNVGDIINIVSSSDDSLIATIAIDDTMRTYDLKDETTPSYDERPDFSTVIIR
ncbi:hypothetical protein TRFO_01968 [Tritrichomonas foetus]|uniref:Anaphase-promoting complex subunit 4 WD40 domain-containing protein n=1 Tax=Tritrichomonas foetus TaxID=1144522 RepID=A0A1J4JH05_9EUKA|nr:hypothetical protein TRFO_01968 [Tritrichomonas foetus]|eukprot:OHS96883.1 hypothetical protein TRFO_01968 [Tritrichomonas foetus]